MCFKNVKEKLETYDHTTKDECNKSAFNFHFISLKIPQFLEKHKILKILNLLKMYKTFQTTKPKWLILLIKKGVISFITGSYQQNIKISDFLNISL